MNNCHLGPWSWWQQNQLSSSIFWERALLQTEHQVWNGNKPKGGSGSLGLISKALLKISIDGKRKKKQRSCSHVLGLASNRLDHENKQPPVLSSPLQNYFFFFQCCPCCYHLDHRHVTPPTPAIIRITNSVIHQLLGRIFFQLRFLQIR